MALFISLKVVLNSKISKLLLDKNKQLCAHLKSAPEKGKANKELLNLLSKIFKPYICDVKIISGFKSRFKILKIETELLADDFYNLIASK